jgi:hypothetical protein
MGPTIEPLWYRYEAAIELVDCLEVSRTFSVCSAHPDRREQRQ